MKTINSIAAWILFVGAFAGLVFSSYGLITYWKSQNEILQQLLSSMTLIDQTLNTTSEGLTIVNNAIMQAKSDLDLIETFTYDISTAVGNTRPTLESVSDLFGEDLTDIVIGTQASLSAVETSAMLIDDTLRIISSIPLIGARYAPAQPLGESINQLSITLGELPQSLTDIEQGLDTTANDLSGIGTSIENLANRIGQIDTNLEDAEAVIADYQVITADLQENLNVFQENLPDWFNRFSFGISILFAWISITSLGLFCVGLLMINRLKE